MFGVYIDGPTIIFNDKKSAVNNSSKIKSTLNKKHSSIAYHRVCQNVSDMVDKLRWISTADNIEEALTKILIEAKTEKLFRYWTY